MAIAKEKLIEMYLTMVRIRAFEERVLKEFAAGNIPGFVHLSSGQEAVAVGACAAIRPDDYITSNHRGHGHCIAKGGKTDLMMAELFGKKTGYCKGKGGSMHLADMDLGILGANGIVGAGITIATGAALGNQMQKSDRVVLCFFSDGASNTTRFHEGINLGAIWNLPVVYLLENNGYAECTSIRNTAKLENLADRAGAYGIPGQTVDGNDVIAVYEAVTEAVARARKGAGPTLVECKTYRIHGHEEGDQQTYKSKEEIESWAKRDPIVLFGNRLVGDNIFTEKEVKKIDQEIAAEIDKAVEFAVNSPFPEPTEALEGVYA